MKTWKPKNEKIQAIWDALDLDIFPGEDQRLEIADAFQKVDYEYGLLVKAALSGVHLLAVIDTMAHYEDYEDMEESAENMGLSYVQYLEASYENIRSMAINALVEQAPEMDFGA